MHHLSRTNYYFYFLIYSVEFSGRNLYSIALRRCPNVGNMQFQKLVQHFGSATAIWAAPKKSLTKILGVGQRTVQGIGDPEFLKFAENEIQFCIKNNVRILLRHQAELPFFLDECTDAPAVLYQKGNFDRTLLPLSIVGTRNITKYGKEFLADLFSELTKTKTITVSGLAVGVDTEMHRESLKHDIPTIGILAHGFHKIYPSTNRKLAGEILANNGALFTEYTTAHEPEREHFIQRNRLIAGMSPATIVVETAFGGGSITTAHFANEYNREVYALPGKITDKYSQGCNALISQNKAWAIPSVSWLVSNLDLNRTQKMEELFPKSEIKIQLQGDQQIVFQHLQNHPDANLDDLALIMDWPPYKLLPVLLDLEIAGYIRSRSGRQYEIVGQH